MADSYAWYVQGYIDVAEIPEAILYTIYCIHGRDTRRDTVYNLSYPWQKSAPIDVTKSAHSPMGTEYASASDASESLRRLKTTFTKRENTACDHTPLSGSSRSRSWNSSASTPRSSPIATLGPNHRPPDPGLWSTFRNRRHTRQRQGKRQKSNACVRACIDARDDNWVAEEKGKRYAS
jgi:hypothetical protein